jgi:prophage regulatory protein
MKTTPTDIMEHLEIDGGQRTIGQLIQDRERALQEIRRLRALVSAMSLKRRSPPVRTMEDSDGESTGYPTEKLIKLAELCKLLDMSRSTIYKMKMEGRFPEPIKVGYRAVRWRLSDIRTWQDSRSSVEGRGH